MAKLFVGLAIAFMIAAAVLGFLAKGNIDKLQEVLRTTKSTLANTQKRLSDTQAELKKTQEELAAAKADIEKKDGEITALTKEKTELTAQLTEARTALEAAQAKVAKAEEDLKNAMTNIPGGNINDLKASIDSLKNDVAKAQTEKAEAVTALNTTRTQLEAKEASLAASQKEVKRYQDGITKFGLTGRILAVNPGWNFVVLSVGDRQGAAVGGVMIVTRGGEPIAKARITSVEPATSIADIVVGSVRRGVSVQPGDTVIYEGNRAKAGNLASPGPGAPAELPQQ